MGSFQTIDGLDKNHQWVAVKRLLNLHRQNYNLLQVWFGHPQSPTNTFTSLLPPHSCSTLAQSLLRNTRGDYVQASYCRAAFSSCRQRWGAWSHSSSMLTFMSFRLCKQTTPRPSIACRHAGHSRQNTEPTGVRSRLWRHNDFLLT